MTEPASIVPVPQRDGGPYTERRLRCPECGRLLPVDQVTECDDCGAWLSVHVRVDTPAAGGSS